MLIDVHRLRFHNRLFLNNRLGFHDRLRFGNWLGRDNRLRLRLREGLRLFLLNRSLCINYSLFWLINLLDLFSLLLLLGGELLF